MKALSFLFLFATLSLTPLRLAAEGVEVHAIVDRNQVGPGDVINLTVSVNSENSTQVDEPRLPNLSGFDLINTNSGVETRSTFVNGKFMTSQSRNFNYMLAVTGKGVLTIPEIDVVVDGKTYKTQPIKISATGAPRGGTQARRGQQQGQGQGQGQGQDPFEEMDQMEELFNQMLQRRLAPNAQGVPGGVPNQNQPGINPDEAFFVLAQTDKTKAYVGEQVTANFYLYTRGQIRDIDTLKYPDLHGFWKEEIEMATRLNFEQAIVNGIPYQRALLVSYALFPIHAGKSTVDSYKAKCTVLTPSAFGFGHPYVFTKASKPITIDVIDVPTQGRPADFSGAVGNFHVSAQFEPPTGTVNQPVTLRIHIEGRGNAKLIDLPKLDLPPTFELYDQKNTSKFLKDGTSFKDFEVLIIPHQPGVFNIPPVSIGVFDPKTKKFTSVASQPLNLSVTGSATTPAPAPQLPQAAGESKAAGAGEPALPPLTTDLESGTLSAATMNVITVIVYLAILAFLAWTAWVSLRRKPKKVSLGLVLNRRMEKIRILKSASDWRKVGVEMTNTIYYILGQISEQGGANQELSRLLELTPPSLRNELSAGIQQLVTQTEALSFAPESMVADMILKGKIDTLIKEFETTMKRTIELAET